MVQYLYNIYIIFTWSILLRKSMKGKINTLSPCEMNTLVTSPPTCLRVENPFVVAQCLNLLFVFAPDQLSVKSKSSPLKWKWVLFLIFMISKIWYIKWKHISLLLYFGWKQICFCFLWICLLNAMKYSLCRSLIYPKPLICWIWKQY